MEYYEDIKLHQKYRSREYHLKEKEIIAYAKKWDQQAFHVDPEFAKKTRFGGLSAAGVHLKQFVPSCQTKGDPKRPGLQAWGGKTSNFSFQPGPAIS